MKSLFFYSSLDSAIIMESFSDDLSNYLNIEVGLEVGTHFFLVNYLLCVEFINAPNDLPLEYSSIPNLENS